MSLLVTKALSFSFLGAIFMLQLPCWAERRCNEGERRRAGEVSAVVVTGTEQRADTVAGDARLLQGGLFLCSERVPRTGE